MLKGDENRSTRGRAIVGFVMDNVYDSKRTS